MLPGVCFSFNAEWPSLDLLLKARTTNEPSAITNTHSHHSYNPTQWPQDPCPSSGTSHLLFSHPLDPSPTCPALATVRHEPCDGIGPLLTGAVEQVMQAMHASRYFERYEVHGDMNHVLEEVIQSINKNKVCIKGGLVTPMGGGVSLLNIQLRRELDLYASLVNCFNLPGLPTRHQDVDIVVIRENTEGDYSGLQHEVVLGVVESLKLITKLCSEQIVKYEFEYAYLNNRKKVTVSIKPTL
ncbi:Isocitrate dehydrogenase regulatory subunit 3 [Hibiscus syriacus]|uniref:Isocitrate dehydrogenase regulatory subunit 3 n=1 Tax=Hibiscus syriacus TaxID=106335 RepID=A0A6A2YWW0_HIBSY|nr:Isocitrate dehydrogenase regulatory subunit 3 [Hibiscus syriacus]